MANETCVWDEISFDPVCRDSLYNTQCRPESFVTKFTPDDVIYCPFCGTTVEKGNAYTGRSSQELG